MHGTSKELLQGLLLIALVRLAVALVRRLSETIPLVPGEIFALCLDFCRIGCGAQRRLTDRGLSNCEIQSVKVAMLDRPLSGQIPCGSDLAGFDGTKDRRLCQAGCFCDRR